MRVFVSMAALLAAAAAGWPAHSSASIPVIVVEFQLEPLPLTLGLDDPSSQRAQIIADELQAEAVRLLSTRYPFIDWVGEASDDVDPVATLEFVMKAETTIGDRVFIEVQVIGKNSRKTLEFSNTDVYALGFQAPLSDQVQETTIERASAVLKSMIVDRTESWQKQLTSRITLAKRVVADPSNVLIVPVAADRLQAGSESILLAIFQAKIGNGLQLKGTIDMAPVGPVHDADNPLAGMQVCDLKQYKYPGFNAADRTAWWNHLRLALESLVRDTANEESMSVRMAFYVVGEDDIDDDF